MRLLRRCLRTALVGCLALSTSGCLLYFFTGHTLAELELGGLETLRVSLRGESTLRTCTDYGYEKHLPRCSYTIDGSTIDSYADLESELGDFAAIIDPLLVQVPANATDLRATYTRDGVTGDLTVTEFTGSVTVDASRSIVPEPGQRLVIIDFPTDPAVGGSRYQFELDFRAIVPAGTPVKVKGVFTAKVAVAGQTFYPPLLPCVTDLGLIPAISVPRGAAPQPISLTGLPSPRGCNGTRYLMAPRTIKPVDVVEYYNAALDHYFITWIAAEVAILDRGTDIRGWVRTGRLLKAHATTQAGTSAICRYYLPPAFGDSHFFGRGTGECAATGAQHPQFVLEDASYLHVILPTAGTCPSGTNAVYRVFSNRADANHRYMDDRALRDQMVARGWLAEGDGDDRVVWCQPQ